MAGPLKKPEKGTTDFSDFDPSELLATHGQHEKSISNLTERMLKVEGHLATPQALALFFKASAEDSRVLDGVFAEMFCRFMNENPEVKAAVVSRMADVDRNFFLKSFKRSWLFIYSVFIYILAQIGPKFIDWVTSLIPAHK